MGGGEDHYMHSKRISVGNFNPAAGSETNGRRRLVAPSGGGAGGTNAMMFPPHTHKNQINHDEHSSAVGGPLLSSTVGPEAFNYYNNQH